MYIFLKVLIVIAIGTLEIWGAIPAGLAMGLDPVLVAVATCIGAISAAMVIIILGDKVRCWILTRFTRRNKKGGFGFIGRIFKRYGAIGFGLLSPLITGVPLGVAIGIALGIPARHLTLWMIIGVFVWTILLTTLAVMGIQVVTSLW